MLEKRSGWADVEFTDEEVVSRVRAGEPLLFEVLMRRHNRRLYRIARSIVGPVHAEDVMQQAYLRSFTSLAQFAGRGPFSTWLTKIAVNEALTQAKRNRRIDSVCEPADVEAAAELLGRIEEAIDKLPEIYRVAFVLRTLEGVDTDEASRLLGVSTEVVKVRLHRARALLREAIGIDLEDATLGGSYPFAGAACDRVVAAVLGELERATRENR